MVGYRVTPGSAVLHGAPLPGRVRLAMVVRKGDVLLPEDSGALAAEDYAYFVAPGETTPRLDWLFAQGRDAREAEQDIFGSFTLPGDVPLGELASFYDLTIPSRFAAVTAAHLFDQRFDAQPQIGDRLTLGRAVVVVRSLEGDRVTQVGLKFSGVGERLISGP